MPRSRPGPVDGSSRPADGPRERSPVPVPGRRAPPGYHEKKSAMTSPAPDRRKSCDTEKPGPAPRACYQGRRQDADRRREARPRYRLRLFSAVFPGPFPACFRPRRPRGRIAARPRPGNVKKRAARPSKRRENSPGPDPKNGPQKCVCFYTHLKPGFSNVNFRNVNILQNQKYSKYRKGGGKYERIQRKIRARDAGTVDGEKPGPPWPGPGTDPGGLYTCIAVCRSGNCIQVSIVYRYPGMQCRGSRHFISLKR